MKRILSSPVVNAVCISLFTAFYALVFYITSGHAEFKSTLYYKSGGSFWGPWSDFLAAGRHAYIASALIAVTIVVVGLLIARRRPYDEYHAGILASCLVAAAVLTLAAIAVFYLMILSEPAGIVEKFTLFIVVHWATVVLSNLVYVLLCRWR